MKTQTGVAAQSERDRAKSPSFAVVIPMYDEELGAERCVRSICDALRGRSYRSTLIAVDDGSRDETGETLARLSPSFSELVVVTHAVNQGYGAALRSGARRAAELGFDYALFMDSDLTNDPRYIECFAREMLGGADIIKGSRYAFGGGAVGVPAYRVALSVVGNRIASALFGLPITDCTNGFRAVRLSIFNRMPFVENGFAMIMEELYYAKFLARSFAEVPYTLTAREETIRKSSFYYRPKVFYQYLKYAVKSFLGIAPQLISTTETASATQGVSRV